MDFKLEKRGHILYNHLDFLIFSIINIFSLKKTLDSLVFWFFEIKKKKKQYIAGKLSEYNILNVLLILCTCTQLN